MDGEENYVSVSTAIAGFVILALVYFLIRRKGPAPEQRADALRPANLSSTSEFHAVSIKFASGACSAAKSLEGKRFLSDAAPRIPLPECDVLECQCRFAHYADRRKRDNRRSPYRTGIAGETGTHQQERRRQADRREDPDLF